MDNKLVVVAIAIVLILVVCFCKAPKKEGFKIPPPQMIDSGANYIPNNQYQPVAGLSGGALRSGNVVPFAAMVTDPNPPMKAKDRIVNEMSNPQEYLPSSMGMQNVYNEDSFNSVRATVRLQKSRLSNTPDQIFNISGGEEPLNSVHKITDHTIAEVFGNLQFDTGVPPPTLQQLQSGTPVSDGMRVGFSSSWSVPPRQVR